MSQSVRSNIPAFPKTRSWDAIAFLWPFTGLEKNVIALKMNLNIQDFYNKVKHYLTAYDVYSCTWYRVSMLHIRDEKQTK